MKLICDCGNVMFDHDPQPLAAVDVKGEAVMQGMVEGTNARNTEAVRVLITTKPGVHWREQALQCTSCQRYLFAAQHNVADALVDTGSASGLPQVAKP